LNIAPDVAATDNTLQQKNTSTSTQTYSKYQAAGSDDIIAVYKPQQVINAAVYTKKYIESYKKLPKTVTIGNRAINTAQLLHLMTISTVQINNKNYNLIPLQRDTLPANTREELKSSTISKAEYVDFAKRIDIHMDSNYQAPAYGIIGPGKVSFQSQIYLYSRVLTSYNQSKALPSTVKVNSWSKNNIPINYSTKGFTARQIASAAVYMKNYYAKNQTYPTSISIGTTKVSQSQFLYLMSVAITKINNKDNNLIYIKDVSMPSNSQEQISTGYLTKAEYIDFVSRIKVHIEKNSRAPNYGMVGLGKMGFENMLMMSARILNGYITSNELPYRVYVRSLSQTLPVSKYRPVYITSDNITDAGTKDINRINTIVNGLKNLGLTAVNFGLGPNTHIKVLTSTSVPANALVVDIYGGACAGTLYEMGTAWYKGIKGTRKVFTVFIPPAKDITGLAFLPRAHDDNFSKSSFTGLAHPDQYLLNNGYNYLRSSDFTTIIKSIVNEAKT
jgi:hypothetical protein